MAIAVSTTDSESAAIRLIRDAEASPLHLRLATVARDRAALSLYDDPTTHGRLTQAQWREVTDRAAREELDAYELHRTAWGNAPECVP